jgi:hypothetical protein
MTKAAFRIAMRVEGGWWVAYLAKYETMEGATELGRIRRTIADIETCKAGFVAVMREALTAELEGKGIKIESWGEEPAPEHEKAGEG